MWNTQQCHQINIYEKNRVHNKVKLKRQDVIIHSLSNLPNRILCSSYASSDEDFASYRIACLEGVQLQYEEKHAVAGDSTTSIARSTGHHRLC